MPILLGSCIGISSLLLISVLIYLPKKPEFSPITPLKRVKNNVNKKSLVNTEYL